MGNNNKTILEVECSVTRDAKQGNTGSFYSAHKPEDIEKWLDSKEVLESVCYFEEVFGSDWDEGDSEDEDVSDVELDFKETEDASEGACEHDEEIQKFLDEEPKRLRDAERNQILQKFENLKVHLYEMKETANQLLVELDKVVKTDEIKNLPEGTTEKKIYRTLKKLTSV